jgi:membrane-associated protease RseP (regulator of RpoE activity)
MEFGDVQDGILGVSGEALNAVNASRLEINETQGFYVARVEKNSGAAKAGIANGDIIKKLDQVSIGNFADLKGYLKTKRPNDFVNVTVLRDNDFKVIPVRLSKNTIRSTQLMGMEVQNLDANDKQRLATDKGVKVIANKNSTLYNRLGIKKGYVLKQLNDFVLNDLSDVIKFKDRYGENALKRLNKLVLINTQGEEERYIFQ